MKPQKHGCVCTGASGPCMANLRAAGMCRLCACNNRRVPSARHVMGDKGAARIDCASAPCLLPPQRRRQRLCDAELAAHEQYSLSSICGGMGLISVPSSCSILYLQCSISGKCEQAASEHGVELS